MYDRDARIAREVTPIECEQMSDLMDMHGRDQPRIMDLHAGDRMGGNQNSPFPMHGFAVLQENTVSFHQPRSTVQLGDRKSVAIPVGWAEYRHSRTQLNSAQVRSR
jgi:hypothetical protein